MIPIEAPFEADPGAVCTPTKGQIPSMAGSTGWKACTYSASKLRPSERLQHVIAGILELGLRGAVVIDVTPHVRQSSADDRSIPTRATA